MAAEHTPTPAVQLTADMLERIIKAGQMTPEQINELKKPYVDPAKAARELRERRQQQEENAEGIRQKKARQDACPHRNSKNDTISLIHNYPDGQPRGICMLCEKV